MSYNLMLHAGANAATLEQVMESPTPEATETHFPIPHGTLITTIKKYVELGGFRVEREEYGLWAEGQRMFGVWALANGSPDRDFQLAIGVRNSHDKSFVAGMGVGSRVFVCDNLAFSAEIVIARKHTRYILRDLDRMVAEAAGKIGAARVSQAERIAAYRETELDNARVHDVVIRAVDAQVIANAAVPKVLKEWREPRHPEFQPRNAWSLMNGFTEVLKEVNPLLLSQRTTRLHGLLDGLTGAFGVKAAEPDFGAGLAKIAGIEG